MNWHRIAIAVPICLGLSVVLAFLAWKIGVTNVSAIVGIVTGTVVGGLVVAVSRQPKA